MKRVNTKKGYVFFAKIDDKSKRYFQYITNDLTQLNSDVIRVFEKKYTLDANPDLEEVIQDKIIFYAHCVIKIGLKLGCWEKVGNISDVGTFEHILFRDTNDYGVKEGEEPIKISNSWYLWRINDSSFTRVGRLEKQYQDSFVGIVINPLGIMELLKGNKYPVFYPDFE